MKLSGAEYRELKFGMKQKSDMELYEEAQKLKPLDQYDVAKDKKVEEIAEREGYLSDAELILEGQTQDARGKTGRKKPAPVEKLECPFTENCYCLPKCPLWVGSEGMCSHKLTAISLAQISNIMSQRR